MMNSCMRPQGQMNGMRNNNRYMPCSDMEKKMMEYQSEGMKGCKEKEKEYPIAMAYVPMQKWRDVVDGCKGLAQGTIFTELALNFKCANKCCNN